MREFCEIKITYQKMVGEVSTGATFHGTFNEAKRYSTFEGVPFTYKFNGVMIVVSGDTSYENAWVQYQGVSNVYNIRIHCSFATRCIFRSFWYFWNYIHDGVHREI